VNVTAAGGGAPVYSQTIPVGAVTLLGAPTLAAGSYTLAFTDLTFPNPLSPLGAVVSSNGQPVTQLTASGNQAFTATAGTYQVFALGIPQAAASMGSYSVSVAPQTGAAVLSVAHAVSASGSSVTAYSYDAAVTTAGTYALDLADFGLSASFTSLKAAAFQNGHMLGSALNAAGTTNVTAAVGPVSVLVFAQPGTGGSLFGLDLTPSGGSALFATTQGVGQLFSSQTFTLTWSSQNATSCSGSSSPSGIWSTTQLSGSGQQTAAITATTTFTLTCTGTGGSTTQTTTVTVSSGSSGGGHGGGSISVDLLAVLAALAMIRVGSRRSVGEA
jgi:hypothetical protein